MLTSKIPYIVKKLPILLIYIIFGLPTELNAQVIQDSSFEAGVNNPYWQDSSLNFQNVICNFTCGNCSNQCFPLTGSYYIYLGGQTAGTEIGWIEQSVFIPTADNATLIFYLKIPYIDAASSSYFSTQLDSNSIFTATLSNSAPYKFEYKKVELDISSYADSSFHLLRFYVYQENITGVSTFLIDDVTIELVTGIEKTEINLSHVEVYPNPSNGVFKVEFSTLLKGDMEYRVYDNTGKMLQKESFQPLNQQLEVDLNQYPAGVYHLQVLHNNQVFHSKLLVQ